MKKTNKLNRFRAGLVCLSAMLVSPIALSETFNEAVLKAHNVLRALHQNTLSLTSDATLSKEAQAWAEHLLATGTLKHSSSDQRSGAGENLYFASQSNQTFSQAQIDWIKQNYPGMKIPAPFTMVNLAYAAVHAWYEELENYDYQTGSSTNGQVIGHFTQVVWKGATKFSCGAAHKTEGEMVKAYVVCRYAPAGNVRGQYTANVLPRKPGAVTPKIYELNPAIPEYVYN
ncbi:MAG: CAP family protein [Pseudomonadota bacterium]